MNTLEKKRKITIKKFLIAKIGNLSSITGGLSACEDPDNDSSITEKSQQGGGNQ